MKSIYDDEEEKFILNKTGKCKGRLAARVASLISLACKESSVTKTHKEIYIACKVDEGIFS